MKINDIDWSEVPDILAKEQVRLLCHCSKRTALYYLKSGKLPCIYLWKKTRYYKIRKEYLMVFIEDWENHPEFYAVPEGWYGGSGSMIRRQYSSAVKIGGEDLHEYYRFLLKEYPDVLEVKKVSEITGYASGLFVKPYDSEHMKMRKHFGAALFAVDVSEVERKNP